MKPLSIIAVIAGLVTLCGVGNLPCFADSGAGVAVQLETTVTGGSSGSGWHDWGTGSSGFSGWTFTPIDNNQPKSPSPYVPPVTNSPLPTPPMPPAYSGTTPSPTVNPPVVSSPAIDWGFALVIAVLAGAIGLLVYLVIRMRKKADNPIDNR